MAKNLNVKIDLETFIEYQQVLKENDVVSTKAAKDQVYQTYSKMLSTKEGKSLMEDHYKFKTSAINLSTEQSFLKDKLTPLVKQTPENIALKRTMYRDYNPKVTEEVSDLAKSLTSKNLHPFLKQHPEKQKHALGVLTRVAGIRQEKNMNLSTQIDGLTNKLTNLMGHLMGKGTKNSELKEMMDKKPAVAQNIDLPKVTEQGQQLEM